MENEKCKCVEEIATLEEVKIIDKTIDTSNFVKREEIADFIKKNVNNLDNYTLTTDLERDYAKKSEIPDTINFITDGEVDEKLDEETRDLLQGLSRELKPDEENGGFSSQTLVNVKNKSGATELIMEIDNLDVKTDVATNSVLGTLKGQDLDDRVKALETTPIKVIEISSSMSNDEKSNHEYPELQLNEDQIKVIMENNISILKVNYDITDRSNSTETDTLVFYTTIDNERVVSGQNTIDTIKINAIRRNDEGILVYHGTMTGSEYYKQVTLTATYNANAVPSSINTATSIWS